MIYSGQGEMHRNFTNGRLEGLSTSFNRKGIKIYEGQFHEGDEIGVHNYWFDNQKTCAIVSYKSNYGENYIDLMNSKLYYPNGNIRCDFKIDKNFEDTLYRLEYSEDGKIKNTLKYSFATVKPSFQDWGGNKYHLIGEFDLGYNAVLIN